MVRLVLVLLLIGWKTGASLLSQSLSVAIAITQLLSTVIWKLLYVQIITKHSKWTWQVKNPNWQEADQLAMYKHCWGVEPVTALWWELDHQISSPAAWTLDQAAPESVATQSTCEAKSATENHFTLPLPYAQVCFLVQGNCWRKTSEQG